VKLRPVGAGDLQVGCYEPVHHIVEVVAPWLAKRAQAGRWALFTPERSVRGERGHLVYGPGVPVAEIPPLDGPDAPWLALYERVFFAQPPIAAQA
jgi:hypothetical protein